MENYIVETKNLTKNFGEFKAVNNVNLKVEKGSIYGFLGPNGVGKSTTIRMLLGLITPSFGESKIFGMKLSENRIDILKKVGSLVESPSYYGNLTAYENLEIARVMYKAPKEQIDNVLEIVDLLNVKNKKVNQFSLGMKQRLAIALALIGNPELVILDEPTNGLDPKGIHEMRNLIKELPKKLGVTVIISSHILSEIEAMATHIGIINKGNLIFQGTIDELKRNSGERVLIEAEPKDIAYKLLNGKGYNLDMEGKYIVIKDKGVDRAKVSRELVLADINLYHISKEEKDLENVFLEMTGGVEIND